MTTRQEQSFSTSSLWLVHYLMHRILDWLGLEAHLGFITCYYQEYSNAARTQTLWRWTLVCSFVSALLSPEASGQQVLHRREDRALNCHLNVTVTQETDTLHKAILDIQDQIRKKVPEYIKNCYTKYHPPVLDVFFRQQEHTLLSQSWALYFTDLEHPAVGSRTNSGSLAGTLRKELCFMKRSFCEFLQGLPQSQTPQNFQSHQLAIFMTSLDFYLYFYPFFPLYVHSCTLGHTNAGAQCPWAGLVLRQGRLSRCWCIPWDPKDFCNMTKTFSNLSGHRFSTSYCS